MRTSGPDRDHPRQRIDHLAQLIGCNETEATLFRPYPVSDADKLNATG
jgi:hypothetical protein